MAIATTVTWIFFTQKLINVYWKTFVIYWERRRRRRQRQRWTECKRNKHIVHMHHTNIKGTCTHFYYGVVSSRFLWFLLCWSGLDDERKKSTFCWVRERSLFFNPISNGNSDHRRFVVMVNFYFLQPQIRFSVSIFISSCYFQLKIRFKKKKLTNFLFELNDKYENCFYKLQPWVVVVVFGFDYLFVSFHIERIHRERYETCTYLSFVAVCWLYSLFFSVFLTRHGSIAFVQLENRNYKMTCLRSGIMNRHNIHQQCQNCHGKRRICECVCVCSMSSDVHVAHTSAPCSTIAIVGHASNWMKFPVKKNCINLYSFR